MIIIIRGLRCYTANTVVLVSYTPPLKTVCCKQTRLSLNNNLLLRLPEFFQDPEQFIPERWARDGLMDNVHPYLLLPFSFGARTCAGQLTSKCFCTDMLATVGLKSSTVYFSSFKQQQ